MLIIKFNLYINILLNLRVISQFSRSLILTNFSNIKNEKFNEKYLDSSLSRRCLANKLNL